MDAPLDSKKVRPPYFELLPLLHAGRTARGSAAVVRARIPCLKVNSDRFSYFLLACLLGDLQAVQALHELGADLTQKDSVGSTALHIACSGFFKERLSPQLVTWLLKQAEVYASIDDLNVPGFNALYASAACGSEAISRILLRYGCNPMIHDTNAETFAYIRRREELKMKEIAGIIQRADMPPREEWRPRSHARFPLRYREAMCTLVVLAKARPRSRTGVQIDAVSGDRVLFARYSSACLSLLPEELLQYLFAYITSIPFPGEWIFK